MLYYWRWFQANEYFWLGRFSCREICYTTGGICLSLLYIQICRFSCREICYTTGGFPSDIQHYRKFEFQLQGNMLYYWRLLFSIQLPHHLGFSCREICYTTGGLPINKLCRRQNVSVAGKYVILLEVNEFQKFCGKQ